MEKNKISVITINWNGIDDTIKCIDSIFSSSYENYEIIVVDNKSKEDEGSILKKKYEDKIILIQSEKNLGFSGGNNLGVKNANGEILFFLNNDAIIQPNTLVTLQKNLNNEDIGIVMPKILFYNTNKIQTAGNFTNLFSKTKSYLRNKESSSFNKIRECEFASGAALMIRKDFYEKIGGFHDFLFIYGDDNSLSYRTWLTGKKVICDGGSVILHDESSSVKKKSRPWFSYHQIRALIATQMIIFKPSTLIKRQIMYSIFQSTAFIKRLLTLQFQFAFAIPRAYIWVLFNLPIILKYRKFTQSMRNTHDDFYLGK